jgi:hypothetical protein
LLRPHRRRADELLLVALINVAVFLWGALYLRNPQLRAAPAGR